jgi:ubiquitin carboxyl-terminal hydrolase 7
MIGIINLGATCYMNSMLQSLFHIAALRRAVYQLPLPDAKNDAKNIPHQLQLLFYRLQTHTAAVDTRALIASFGWTGNEVYQQHDVQEFARVLLDHLDVSMSKVKSENNFDASPSFIKYLFEGKSQTYIDCPAVRYSSVRDESFFDISLDVQGAGPTLMDSLRRYIAIETLNGDNQYRTPSNGLQDAVRGTRFLQFPRVLQLQLKRFAYDPNLDAMSKVNDRFEFPIELDLSTFLHRPAAQFPSLSLKAETDLECQYLLHSVLVHSGSATGGHYYVFVRPDPLNQPSVWYRLDDDRVARCPTQEAVNDNFGGPPDQQQSIFSTLSSYFVKPEYANRQHSAYMLTYIRASDAPQLLKPVLFLSVCLMKFFLASDSLFFSCQVLNTDIPSALLDAMSLQQLASEAAAAELRYDQIRVNLQLLIEPELVAKFGIELHKTSVGSKRKVSELLSSEDKFYSFNQLATDRLSVCSLCYFASLLILA